MMKRKGLALLLCLTMTFSLFGCKGADKNVTDTSSTEANAEIEGNMVPNGSFNESIDNFYVYEEGGSGETSWDSSQKCLVADIKRLGSKPHGFQVYVDPESLVNGVKYEFSFDASCTMDRSIDWRFQINGSDYHSYAEGHADLTSEMQHYSVEFVMEENTDPAPRLCFNMGYTEVLQTLVADPESVGAHTVYIDNVCLKVLDESNADTTVVTVDVPNVRVNQIGYLTGAEKYAVVADLDASDTTYDIVDAGTDSVVYSGTIPALVANDNTGEKNATIDFSDFTTAGTYKIRTSAGKESYSFIISDDIYSDAYSSLLKMLYLQRCGTALTEEEAGAYAHDICHNTEAKVYSAYGEFLEVSGGWHDAGDYGRYVVSGVKAVADLFVAYNETSNKALLDEAKYEMDWLLKMQDTATGGVYHKVSGALFPGTVMPEEETATLILSPISNTATGDFAAITAMASALYKDDADYSAKCLEASKKAYDYVVKHVDSKGFANPSGIVTGEYPDDDCEDEAFWAAVELYIVTGEESYFTEAEAMYKKLTKLTDLGWANMSGYGVYDALTSKTMNDKHADFTKTVKEDFLKEVDSLVTVAESNPYGICRSDSYEWGSNMGIANNGIILLMANKVSASDKYTAVANNCLNYLFGINATGYCFVTGTGTLSPDSTHHRPSQSTGETMPGMLVGGVNNGLDDPYAQAVLKDTAPAKCYVDNEQSYSCNEVCVYWNSPLIALLDLMR